MYDEDKYAKKTRHTIGSLLRVCIILVFACSFVGFLAVSYSKIETKASNPLIRRGESDTDEAVNKLDASEDDVNLASITPQVRASLSPLTSDTSVDLLDRRKFRLDRVYCMIPTYYTRTHSKLWASILKSWGPRCDVIKFFVDPPNEFQTEVPPKVFSVEADANQNGFSADVVVVPMIRKNGGKCSDGKPCRHIWEKVWRSWVYVFENDLHHAEWFCKIDDDSYFIPSNLRKYVRNRDWNPDDKHYFGWGGIHHDKSTFISGTLTAFSRGTIRALGPVYQNLKHEYGDRKNFRHGQCVDRDGATEEATASICLRSIGIEAEPCFDEIGREHVVPLGIPFTLTYYRKKNTTSWYWVRKPYTRGDEQNCCSPNAWGIHGYKSHVRMMEMEGKMYIKPIEQIADSMHSYKKYSDEWYELWYIIQLRKGIQHDMQWLKRLNLNEKALPIEVT